MSPENTVALVPSEKVTVSMPQSSTSTGLDLSTARSSGRRHAATLPTSQITLATLIASPRAFALHEQNLVFGGPQDLHGLGHRRRVDPVFCIHEEPASLADRRAGAFHFFYYALVHQGFWDVLADWRLVVFSPEITRKGLFADDMFAGLHRI